LFSGLHNAIHHRDRGGCGGSGGGLFSGRGGFLSGCGNRCGFFKRSLAADCGCEGDISSCVSGCGCDGSFGPAAVSTGCGCDGNWSAPASGCDGGAVAAPAPAMPSLATPAGEAVAEPTPAAGTGQ
jgi:hypothetical protein